MAKKNLKRAFYTLRRFGHHYYRAELELAYKAALELSSEAFEEYEKFVWAKKEYDPDNPDSYHFEHSLPDNTPKEVLEAFWGKEDDI